MSGKLFDRYGAILEEDVEVLEHCLWQCGKRARDDEKWEYHLRAVRVSTPRVMVAEIGMHDGATGKGMERYLRDTCNVGMDYYGIDPDPGTTRPRHVMEHGNVIIGDSSEVFDQVPDGLDLVWVDGCHCINHVILDTIHYSSKVRVGGFILFHDVNPAGQGQEHQYHGPMTPAFGLAIDAAHRAMHWPFPGWSMVMEKWPTDVHNCGTRAYQRTA